MTDIKKQVYEVAEYLGARTDTDWAYENEWRYELFESALNEMYEHGDITAEEFDELALTAFYDYYDFKTDMGDDE